MIMGFDHLALTVTDVSSARKSLEKQGFQCLFLEKNIPNNPQKAKLLEHYQATHEIGFFTPTKGTIALEIVNHGNIVQNKSGPYERRDRSILLRTADVATERDFWMKGLRFKHVKDFLLELSSPVPGWGVLLELTEEKKMGHSTLDASGYTCLALYSNNIEKDLGVVTALGATDIVNRPRARPARWPPGPISRTPG